MKYVAVVLASAMLFIGSCSKKNEQKEEVRKPDPKPVKEKDEEEVKIFQSKQVKSDPKPTKDKD